MQKSVLDTTTGGKITALKPVPISNLKNAIVPEQHDSMDKPASAFTDADCAFLKKVMTDLTEKEQDQLIAEMKKILNHTSRLSPAEQEKVIESIGNYIILATEGEDTSIKWWGQPGHYQLSMGVPQFLGTMTSSHGNSLGDYASWADNNRSQPPFFWLVLNRHSWVLDGTGVPGFDDYGPDSLSYFINDARTDFNNYDADSAYIDIGKSLHYIEDLGCPYHTTGGSLPQHAAYEDWVGNNWDTLDLDSAIQVGEYYVITDPVSDSKAFAEYTHQFLSYFNYEINNDPDWQTDPYMINYTQILNAETERMTIGMAQYANKYESPDTAGSSSVAISDLQTSYAYMSGIADSDSVVLPILISHPDASELEIWIGCREDSGDNYTDYKVWDRQAISGSELVLYVQALGFDDMHDWRLQVKDNVSGNTGSINEFSIHITHIPQILHQM